VTILDRVIRLDIGVVGNGDMKLFELHNQDTEVKLPYDLAEDLYVFMKNDPQFYRKQYFPGLCQCSDRVKADQDPNLENTMRPIIKSAFESYADKFKVPSHITLEQEDEDKVCEMISEEEMDTIRECGY